MVTVMNPDGSNVAVYADGLRNSVGIEWAEGNLYATANGVDHLGPNAPDELLFRLEEGEHYGWPFCYEKDGAQLSDTSQAWTSAPASCNLVPHSLAAFPPRSAPLGLRFFDSESHPLLRNSFLVALHGSFDVSIGSGYEIRRVARSGSQELFMDGFLDASGARVARAVDFLQKDANSFFFTDDHGGRVFYVFAE
jgi:glucose/arabinose dehydrogenase